MNKNVLDNICFYDVETTGIPSKGAKWGISPATPLLHIYDLLYHTVFSFSSPMDAPTNNQIISYNKNCIRTFLGHLMQFIYLTIFSNRQRWHTADHNF